MAKVAKGRIQKVLASAGIGSRRQIEAWVRDGRINVNGQRATPGQAIGPSDRVEIDGRPIDSIAAAPSRVLLYHKPVGEICTRVDPAGRPTVFDSAPPLEAGRWIGVGRLDINSVGLMLLTTDGVLASALMHPGSGVVREYAVRVLGDLDDRALAKLRRGVMLDDGPARFETLERQNDARGSNRWYRCALREGRKREVRRLFEAVGGKVNRLIRVRYGPVLLPRDLPPGAHRELSSREIAELRQAAGLPPPAGNR